MRSLILFIIVFFPFRLLGQSYKLGDYLSIKDHPKSKGVNLKLKVPIGWEIKEGERPNIVKKFEKEGNTFLISIKENATFFSRNEIKEELQKEEGLTTEYVKEVSSLLNNAKILDQSIMTIDTYPTIKFKVKGTMERAGFTLPVIMRMWIILYEDKIVFLQSMGTETSEFRSMDQLYFQITNSVIFPEQYN